MTLATDTSRNARSGLSRRDSIGQPRVAAQRLPWVRSRHTISTPKGLRNGLAARRNPFRFERVISFGPQGSRCAATLGYPTKAVPALLRADLRLLTSCLLLLLVANRAAMGDETVVVRTAAGRQAQLTGEILDYDVRELHIRTTDGREQVVPSDRVLRIETQYVPEQFQAERARDEEQYDSALLLYQKALAAEPRRWARHAIIREMIGCHRALGRVEQSGEMFLLLARDGPNSSDLAAMPLAWSPGMPPASLERAAQGWMARDDLPAAVLLGASHLLSIRPAEAMAGLKRLASEADGPIAQLAAAQLWRTEIVTADAQKTDAWRRAIDRMSDELRPGPQFVLGQSLARQGQHEQATLALLRVPILDPGRRELAPVALVEAGRSLEKLERTHQAAGLYREVLRDYPTSPAAAEAIGRLEALAGTQK